MDKLIIYAESDLATMARAATQGKPAEQWLADMHAKIAAMIKARPAAYLSFGPWWWAVKDQLVVQGLMQGHVNPELLAAVTTGNPVLDMAGALAYHGWNVDQMRDGNVFAVDTVSGDQVDFVLADEELDALISAPR